YDENGYVVKKLFRRDNTGGRDERGTPTQDIKGRWGFMHKYDGMGRAIETQALDKNGEPTSIDGVYFVRTDYGNTPYGIKSGCYDENGSPVLDIRGISFTLCDYDEYFNVLSWSCYGVNGERVLNRESNLAQGVFTYDPEKGFVTSASYYDTELAPCMHKDGNFRVEVTRNSEGRITGNYYYGVDGRRTTISGGYSGVRTEYNSDGQRSKVMFLDTEDNPAVNTDENVYGYKYSYENGFTKIIDRIDANGNLMLNKYGYASITVDYDTVKNKLSGLTYTDTEGKRVLTSWGYAEERYTYYQGNKDSQSYYDEEGKPAADSSGVAKYTYDWKDGNRISEKCFDKTGRLTANAQGYASAEYEYDENGLKIWERYYDSDGKRTVITDGYSAVQYTYNNKGNKASTTYYDAENNHMIQPDEYYCYSKRFEYYDNGRLKSIQYVREENSQYQEMLNRQVEYVCYEYDSHGNETKKYRFNSKGEAVDAYGNTGGSVIIEQEYDSHGKTSKYLEYRNGEKEAWIVQEYERDSLGRLVSTYAVRYTGGKGDVLVRKWEYDAYGRRCKECWLNGENKLFIPNRTKEFKSLPIDYAIQVMSHDIFGNETDVWYYDGNGEPLYRQNSILYLRDTLTDRKSLLKKAFHTVRTYNAMRKVLTESYYNDENMYQPVQISDGFHKVAYKYDAFGHETERSLYDTDGKLIQREVKSYNSFGQIASIETYNADGKPLYVNGYFKVVYAYDPYGNKSDIWYFDADGKPCRRHYKGKACEHHLKRSYYAKNKILSEELFDTEEKPDSSHDGIHKAVYVYNSYGWRIEEAQYDADRHLLNKKLFKYDSAGNKTGEEWVK
ncbi:MAG: hypothetical protein IJU07_02985, partial [Synergistaceae bacterium]|nr:hypothetical protein [Synergistaceae bacterium]